MNNIKSQLTYQRFLKLALLSAGVTCLSATSTLAGGLNNSNNPSSIYESSNSYPIKIAQNFALCSDPEGDFVPRVWAETKDFLVNICYYFEGGSPTYYGRSKKTGSNISLPVQSESNGRYVAVNGNVRYILTPTELIVTEGRKVILRQSVLRFRRR
jgi:hypothetical protein